MISDLTDVEKQTIIYSHKNGESMQAIAKNMAISFGAVHNFLKRSMYNEFTGEKKIQRPPAVYSNKKSLYGIEY